MYGIIAWHGGRGYVGYVDGVYVVNRDTDNVTEITYVSEVVEKLVIWILGASLSSNATPVTMKQVMSPPDAEPPPHPRLMVTRIIACP